MQNISDYKIIEEITVGKSTAVFRAKLSDSEDSCILKILLDTRPSLEDIARFKHEYYFFSKSYHSTLHAVEMTTDRHQLAMVCDDFPGCELLEKWLSHTELNLETFLEIAIKLCGSLKELHDAGIIHKNINPQTILIANASIKIMDMSIASAYVQNEDISLQNEKLEGTLAYLSPEQTGRTQHVPDERGDLYSLGITFYQMLTGTLPFKAHDTAGWIHCHLAKWPTPINKVKPEIPAVLNNIVMKLMAKNPDDRYNSVSGLLADLVKCRQLLKANNNIEEFILGLQDLPEVLRFPQTLFGRDEELAILSSAYEKAQSGKKQILMVSGAPGIGKSSLIDAFKKQFRSSKTYFFHGKYDQFKHDLPYHAIIESFHKRILALLTEPPQVLKYWRSKLKKAMGNNGAVLFELIPEIQLIIGAQPPVPPLPPTEARNRFELVLMEFARIFVTKEAPFVLILDDLQWADMASFSLLKKFVEDERMNNAVFICVHRDSEISQDHPIYSLNKIVSEKNLETQYIKLENLNENAIMALLHTVFPNLKTHGEEFLSQILYANTEGNPLFVKSLLQQFYSQKLIYFDLVSYQWCYDEYRLRAMSVSENVVDIVLQNLQNLPKDTQALLRQAACIGNEFDLGSLTSVCELSPQDTAKLLWPAIRERIISILNSNYNLALADNNFAKQNQDIIKFRFGHDRIHQAVMSQLNDVDRKALELKIGRLFFNNNIEGSQVDLFSILEHYNLCLDLIVNVNERLKIAELNIVAGVRAKKSIAYDSAKYFFEAALKLLHDKNWDNDYVNLFELNLNIAESAFLSGDIPTANHYFDILIERANDIYDKAEVYRKKMVLLNSVSLYVEAVDVGLKALALFNLSLPKKPSIVRLLISMVGFKLKLGRRNIGEIELFPINHKKYITISEILGELLNPVYHCDEKLFVIVAIKNLTLSIEHGYSRFTSLSAVAFAVALLAIDQFDFAFSTIKFAEKYLDEKMNISIYLKYKMAYGTFFYTFLSDPKDGDQFFYKLGEQLKEMGDYNYAVYNMMTLIFYNYCFGKSIPNGVDKAIEYLRDFYIDKRHMEYYELYVCMVFIVEFLKSPTNIQKQFPFDTEKIMARDNDLERYDMLIMRLEYDFMQKKYEKALEIIPYIKPIWRKIAVYQIPRFGCILGICLIRYCEGQSYFERIRIMRHVNWLIHHTNIVIKANPATLSYYYHLLVAVKMAYINDIENAMRLFEKVVVATEKEENYSILAIAQECFAELYLKLSMHKETSYHYQEALYAYNAWGNQFKVNQIQALHPELYVNPSDKVLLSSKQMLATNIDLSSIMKSAQVITSRAELSELLTTLLSILSENAGASRCLILLKRKEELWVEAESNLNAQTKILTHEKYSERTDISQKLIQYVVNTRKFILIENSQTQIIIDNCPYFARQPSLSVLCFPIIEKGNLIGVVYLENRLSTSTFTDGHLEVLRILSSQMAISLDNSLYNQIYDPFVPHQFLDILGKHNIMDIQLGDHIEKEMGLLFVDVQSFAQISKQLQHGDTLALINQLMGLLEPIVARNKGFIDKYMGDAIMILFSESTHDLVQAAIETQVAIHQFNQERQRDGLNEISICIGLDWGPVMLGTMGGHRRIETTVIGDAVNVASRLEKYSKELSCQILLTKTLFLSLSQPIAAARYIGRFQIRANSELMAIYEIFAGEIPERRDKKLGSLPYFNEAMNHFENKNYKEALILFQKCLSLAPDDQVAMFYLKQCRQSD